MKKEVNGSNNGDNSKVGQEQLYDLLTSHELSWQAILLDLINTEQLNPWDIDLAFLSQKYIERIKQLQEASFFISSKVLLAAAILLRIKSEILHSKISDIDEILFPKEKKKEDIPAVTNLFDFAPEELPEIMPRTPLPRFKKITLNELMSALDTALKTEQRRIKRELFFQRAERVLGIAVFNVPIIDIRKKISEIFDKIKDFLSKNKAEKMTFLQLAGNDKTERIATFVPLIHLDHQNKIWLEQQEPFSEINITLKKIQMPVQEQVESMQEQLKDLPQQ